MERDRRGRARALAILTGGALMLALVGCTSGPAPSGVDAGGPAATITSTTSPTPTATPTLDAGGDAADNLAYFDYVNKRTLAKNAQATGPDFIAALVTAGFAKRDMQLTSDTTSAGLKADSIQFSVRLGNTCLIGQNGSGSGGYHGEAVTAIPGGSCLVGATVKLK